MTGIKSGDLILDKIQIEKLNTGVIIQKKDPGVNRDQGELLKI